MARKRINKNLVTILVLVALGFLLLVFFVFLSRYRDPQPFVDEAQTIITQAREAEAEIAAEVKTIVDPEQAHARKKTLLEEKANPLWDEAMKLLKEAQTYAIRKHDKASNLEIARQQLGICEERRMYNEARNMRAYLLKQDPDLYDIQLKQATFFQELGENGAITVWPTVKAEAEELIRINEKEQQNDPTGYLFKAQAMLGMVAAQTDEKPDETMQQAQELLETCREQAADRPLWYHLRGQLELLRGRDLLEAAQREHFNQAGEYYQAGIEAMPDNPEAYLNKLRHYSLVLLQHKFQQVLRMQETQAAEVALQEFEQQAQSVTTEVDEAIARFADEPEFLALKSQVLSLGQYPWRRFDERIALYEQALTLDRADAFMGVRLASIYMQRRDYPGLGETKLERAYELLQKALYDPDLLDFDGPRQGLVRSIRYYQALPTLIDVCIQWAQNAGEDKEKRERYLSVAQSTLKELEDQFPERNILVLLAQGKLALAQGQREEGLNYLSQADRLTGAGGERNSDVKTALFHALRGTANHGLALQYGLEAIRDGNKTERMYFDYAQALLERPDPGNLQILGQILDNIEKPYSSMDYSRRRFLRLRAELHIRRGEIDAAREDMEALTEKDFDLQLLWAQAQATPEQRVAMLEQLRQGHVADSRIVQLLVSYYTQQYAENGDAKMLAQARTVVDAALAQEPQNITFQQLRRLLDEPSPTQISSERAQEITLELLQGIEDSFERNQRFGDYYEQKSYISRNAGDDAAFQAQAKKALEYFQAAQALQPDNLDIYLNLFTLNQALKNTGETEAILSKVRSLDATEALRFEAMEAMERKEWAEAANRLEKYLETRPISSSANLALSQAYAALGRNTAALEKAQLAVRQNDRNAGAHRQAALLLHKQYQQMDPDSLTLSQVETIMQSIAFATRLAPQDVASQQLKVYYYPLMIKLYTQRAQTLDKASPAYQALQERIELFHQDAVNTARGLAQSDPKDPARRVLSANLYYRFSQLAADNKAKEDYLRQAEETYQTALKELPDSKELLEAYRTFLMEQGRVEDAVAMLQALGQGDIDDQTRWNVRLELVQTYVGSRDYERALAELQAMLQEKPSDRDALIFMGDVRQLMGNNEEAISSYQQARKVKDDERLAVRCLEIIMQTGDLERARKALEELRQTYPDYDRLDLLEANLAILNADYDKAARLAEQTLQKNEDDVVALLILGRAQFFAAKYENALETYRRLRRKVGSTSTTGQLDMARALWMLRRRDEALTEVRGVVDKAPTPESRRILISMLRFLKRWTELEQYYTDLIKVYNEDVRLRLQRANVIIARGDDAQQSGQERLSKELYQRGLAELRESVKMSRQLKRNQVEALTALLEALLRFKDYQNVLSRVDENLTGEETDALWWGYKATALSQMGRQDEAIALFEQSQERVKDKPALQDRLLGFVPRMQDAKRMIAWCEGRIGRQPQWLGVRMALADLYRQEQNSDLWIKTLEDARNCTDNTDVQALVDQRLGTAYLVAGKADQAIEVFRRLIQSQPKNVDIINNLAYLLLEQKKDIDEALKLAEQAYELSPTRPNIMDTYALALLETKDFTKAEWMLRRAIQQLQRDNEPVTPEYYFHLGLALKGNGEKGEAVQQFEAALQGLREGVLSVGDTESLRRQIEQALKEE
ncbi:MAG: tetratricopeptide repeat protein [Sedimentisphaerales bacterium]|nr:tetratricopeptide repeat protein [Sedimentisphaerales bacterium]